jgi:amino acid adenylation domain-containing protein
MIAKARETGIIPGERGARPPLSSTQRALWFLEQLDPSQALYNVSFAARISGNLDVGRLAHALRLIASRHEALRTAFPVADSEPYQHVSVGPRIPLAVSDLTGAGSPERDEKWPRLVDSWSREPFDLATGPLITARLIRLAEQDHILSLVMHHAICDGPSVHILFAELAEQYAGEPLRPPLPLHFADYAAWQRRHPPSAEDLNWWRDYLADIPGVLTLPTDRQRPRVRGTTGSTLIRAMPGALVASATDLARSLRATPFMVMMAAYAALLGRLSGMRTLIAGTPVSHRPYPELEGLIGCFVNTLPLRLDLRGDPSFADLVRRIRNSALDALAHQQAPFDVLVDELRIERRPDVTPLVQAILTFEPAPLARPLLADLEVRLLNIPPVTAKFDLDMMIVQAPDETGDFEASFTYSTDLFERATISRIADGFQRILAAGVADPAIPLRRLPLLTDSERQALIRSPGTTGRSRPVDALVPELFARQAAASPDAPAISDGDITLRYAELDARADSLAERLRAHGVAPDEVIAVLLPRGADQLTAILGILKAGAAYLPLDPAYPVHHLIRTLGIATVRLAVTVGDTAHLLRGAGIHVICPGGSRREAIAEGREGKRPGYERVHPGNLAYVIFTSGSTGVPRGVAVPHRALANHALAIRDAFGLGPDDRVLQFASIGFDVAAEEIFPTWLAGGCVVVPGEPPSPRDLTRFLATRRVTIANLPASYWQRWLATLDPRAPFAVPSLRLLVTGSEQVMPTAVTAWHDYPAIPVLNAYGLSETTITSLVHRVEETFANAVVPVGQPIEGVRAYVLDAELEPVPTGTEGELYIGGSGLARGYAGNPGLTADRFVPDPHTEAVGARMCRTRDRARRRPDGAIEILGRVDEQLKIRGHRIEPAGIEAVLCSHPDVAQAAVVARPGTGGELQLVGYVVTKGGSEVPADLRTYLTSRLPVYEIPTAFVRIDALPLSAAGKVNRQTLPAPPAGPPASPAVRIVQPQTSLERALAEIWRDVLELEMVSLDDNFFDLGGTSFSLMTVQARICELVRQRPPIVAFYEYPTIRALARYLHSGSESSAPAGKIRAARPQSGRARLSRRREAAHVRG